MAYFPNGSSGEAFQAQFCAKCANADEDGMCAIWDAHMLFNYDQLRDGQDKLRDCLSLLIEDEPSQCRMFLPLS